MKYHWLKSKKNFIGVLIFLVVICPIIILGFFGYKNRNQEIIKFTLSQQSSLAHLAVITLKERFDRVKDLSVSLATRPKVQQLIQQGKWEEAIKFLEGIPQNFPLINRILLADPQGVLMADIPYAREVKGMNFAHRDWYKGVMKTKKTYVSEIYTRTAKPSYNVVAFATPIQSEQGTFLGILVLQVTLDTFLEWGKNVDVGPEGLVYFLDYKGQLAGHPEFAAQGQIIDYSKNPIAQKILRGEGGAERLFNKKEEQIVAYEPVPEYNWGVIVEQPARVALATFNSNLSHKALIYGVIFLLSCLCALLILRSITKPKQLQALLFRLAAIVESSEDAILSKNLEGIILSWNKGAERIYGYSASEAVGKPISLLVPPGLKDETSSLLEKIKQGQSIEHYETLRICKKGKLINVSLSISPLKDQTGKVIGASSIARDITGRKRAEEENRNFFTLSLDMLCIAGFDGYFKKLNPSWAKTLGFTMEELCAKPFIEFVHPEDREKTIAEAQKLSTGIDVISFENRYLCKNGSYKWILWNSASSLKEELIYASARDITERKQAEENLKRLNEDLKYHATQLEAANKEIESFSYSVSHDLRAPLRSIDGFSQALLEDYGDKLNQEGKSNLERVRAGCKRMSQLIDDMLNLSRLSRAEMRLEKVDLTALAQEIAEELKKIEPERKVTFNIKEGLFALGDLRLLKTVLENLLNNAWKYTSKHPTAHIAFNASQQNGKTVFYVKDDGVGFDMQYADKLFGVFQRLHRMDEFEGNGVGLATVKRVIHRHGGEVWAEGEVNKGATFYFTL